TLATGSRLTCTLGINQFLKYLNLDFQSTISELMISDDEIKAVILFKLHKRGNWGASHTAFDNLKKGFKDEDLGSHGGKRVEKIATFDGDFGKINGIEVIGLAF
ncbi:MAG: hypothetical protein ACRD9Q_10890, partial [Nitrososphaeraceae archaeon]